MTPLSGFGHPQRRPSGATIEPLRPEDSGRVSLGWSSNFVPRDLEQHLRTHPGLSWWEPGSGEYLIGGPWRNRAEIAVVQELTARLHTEALTAAFTTASREHGLQLAVILDQHEARPAEFYRRIGFDLLQQIIVYELPRLPRPVPEPATLCFTPVRPEMRDTLLGVDHAAFPWLWWNSATEFASYGSLYGVEIFIGCEADGTPVAYVGITSYRGWGHLDRIAVIPGRQGRGYGLETLNFAVAHLGSLGARRIGLSTQADNLRSRQLYERYGFRRTAGSDYTIYGTWLNDEGRGVKGA